ncbi:hypothetical protein [Spirosoma terrae]|uniref:Uncharacterized protein n=1 Tax=Spirosoma terrae TaxID=1968276 RepID=A0A6L9LGZ4_9BACT|nr:hypothetical protein [Spirosoma terrae]NDU97868.1 hypothetical protein [Spirosoma terrae]
MKNVNRTKQNRSMSFANDLYLDETDGIFDDNWIVSANDLFGSFIPGSNEADLLTFYDQAA